MHPLTLARHASSTFARVASSILLTLLIASAAFAQGAIVAGRVVDVQGANVSGAQVTLTRAGTPPQTTRTNATGEFTFGGVTPGDYTMRVEAGGFADWTRPVTVGTTRQSVDVALQVAGLTEDVTVEGALSGTVATGKTNQPVKDLPLTINAVTSETIQEQGINDLTSALQNVSGVFAFTNYGVYEAYTFRGFLDLFPSTANQLVDGVRNEGNRINSQLANIDRVEVLKGPSSALYGGGAQGATVNLIRKKPSAQPAYDVAASFGSWENVRGQVGATGRLAGRSLLYRLDIGADSKDGYRHNETRRVSITPSVSWRIGSRDQVNAYFTYNRDKFGGDAGIPLLADGEFPAVPRDRNYRTPFDRAISNDSNLQLAYARQLNGSFGFRNTLSYRHFNDDYFIVEYLAPPEDGTSLYREFLQFYHHRRPLTNIAEVTGRITKGIEQNLVFGWEGQRYHNSTNLIPGGGVLEAAEIDIFNPVETQTEPDEPLARVNYFTNKTNAFYFQDNLTLAEPLKLMVGGRYDIFRRSTSRDNVVGGVLTEDPTRNLDYDAEAFTGRVGLVYQPMSRLDLYASYANAFTPQFSQNPDGSSLDPVTSAQVEFGQRVRMANDRVQVNTSIFHIRREKVPFSRPGGIFIQAGEMRSRGFEADLSTVPAGNWRINASYGFTDVEFLDYAVTATTNLRGNAPSFAPRHTFNVWSGYEFPHGLGVNVGVRAVSSLFLDDGNDLPIDGYGLLNLGVRYRHGRLEYALNVNNATDTEYFASSLYDTQMYPGEPINVLGTVRVRLN